MYVEGLTETLLVDQVLLLGCPCVFLLNLSVSKMVVFNLEVVRISRIYWVVRFKHVCFRRSTGHLDSQTQLGSVGQKSSEICASWCCDGVLRGDCGLLLDVAWVFLRWARTEGALGELFL